MGVHPGIESISLASEIASEGAQWKCTARARSNFVPFIILAVVGGLAVRYLNLLYSILVNGLSQLHMRDLLSLVIAECGH